MGWNRMNEDREEKEEEGGWARLWVSGCIPDRAVGFLWAGILFLQFVHGHRPL